MCQDHATWSISLLIMGKGMYDNFLPTKPKSSQNSQWDDFERSIYMKETKCESYLNILVFVDIHIRKENGKKLDTTGLKGIFIRYSASSKAHWIYIKEDHRIEVNRDVMFNEIIAYKKSKDVEVDSSEEEMPIFQDISRDNDGQDQTSTHEDVEGPSNPTQ